MSANLSSLLNTAGSVLQLSNPVGKFLRAIANSLVTSGVSAPQYLNSKRGGSDQTFVGANNNINLNVLGASRGIAYDTSVGAATLTPGKTYRITVFLAANTFSSGATGSLTVKLVDDTNTPLTNPTMDTTSAQLVPATSSSDGTGMTAIDFVYQVPSVPPTSQLTRVKIRCTAANGTASILTGSSSMVIQEIPG